MSRDPYWNHNTHYHRWLLGQVPPTAKTALDIGCGDGLLANKLGRHCPSVLGIDIDEAVLTKTTASSNVRFEKTDFRSLTGTFDFVTAVASMHHVPLREGMEAVHRLVAPGGTLVIVGLWKMSARADTSYLLALPAIRAVDACHPAPSDPAPMRDAEDNLAQIRASAADILPGARIRRRLMWRYTLRWRKPF
ncbi:class I SAM-dependent methyltransferase [Nocardia australiensis]|uniref:class I SAM-dependent methyltransferase n=1 Tax=Nocardia australiensis TaxID=2887191 RepID=UPI001D14ED1F|nr:class I SAM-dependent methyltransferase [Nocardia australiensis]